MRDTVFGHAERDLIAVIGEDDVAQTVALDHVADLIGLCGEDLDEISLAGDTAGKSPPAERVGALAGEVPAAVGGREQDHPQLSAGLPARADATGTDHRFPPANNGLTCPDDRCCLTRGQMFSHLFWRFAVDPDLTLAPLAAPPQANRDCEHKVIMRASARLVSGSAGIGDMTAKVLKLLAQRFTLAQLVGEAQLAGMQARVDAARSATTWPRSNTGACLSSLHQTPAVIATAGS